MPSRVIDLGRPTKRGRARLIETRGRHGHYVALSHCWGQGHVLKTLNATYKSFCNKIPPKLLSKTFKDTITLTRRLGPRYVWIDSICIIQDDLEDWRRESGEMRSVYSNAYLVLAADRSRDGS